MDRESLEIRSYRVCFELDRRIYRLERWRLPVPWGLPLRSIGYASAALVAILFAQGLPLLGVLIGALPAPVRLCLLPIGIAYALTVVRVDGRPAHSALLALARFRLAPRWIAAYSRCHSLGAVARLGELCLAPDGRDTRLRRGRIKGPATVLLRYPGAGRQRHRRLVIEQTSQRPMWRGKTVEIPAGHVLEVRS